MNLMLWYMNVEEKGDMSIKNVDVSDRLTKQKMKIGGDVNVMINKNVSNYDNKISNEDWVSATPNSRTSLFKIVWDNIGSGDSNKPGLDNKNARETDIESNGSIGVGDACKLDNLNAAVDRLALNMRYGDQSEMTSDEMELDKEVENVDLINLDESDWISEGRSKDIFDVFVESNLINFGYIEGESVINNDVKEEIIKGTDDEMFGWSQRIGDVDVANRVNKVEHCCQVRAMNVLEALLDVVIEIDNIAKDLLKALMDDDFDEFDYRVDLFKWHLYMNFEDLDTGNKDRGDSGIKNEDRIEVTKDEFADDRDRRAVVHANRIINLVVDSVVENGIFGWYQESVVNSNLNKQPNHTSNGRRIRSVFDREKSLLVKNNWNSRFCDVDYAVGEIYGKELETLG